MNERQFEEAVARMTQGDKTALKEIYESYAGYIYRIVYEVLRNRENAEDVTSEFFIRLWNKAQQFKPGSGHKGYLATMARNMAIDFLRKYRREELTALLQDLGEEPEKDGGEKAFYPTQPHGKRVHPENTCQERGGFYSRENQVERQVLGDMTVSQALDTLKPSERQIVSLKVLGEMTFKEIAASLQIPMGTVAWKYQNAIKKLRRCGYE